MCRSPSRLVRELPGDFVGTALADYTESPVPSDVQIADYTLLRCTQCELEFSDPPEPAADAFYEWLDRVQEYYPGERWEWGEVARQVSEHVRRHGQCRVLELGAGAGFFLNQLKTEYGAQATAIERSEDAAAKLRAQGIECLTPQQAASALTHRTFDFVVAFHCLEHVADPLSMIVDMNRWAGPDGRIFVSVPYSPMFYESQWFDPLNHPPHHMTRWNQHALAALARQIKGEAQLYMPPALSLTARARMALCIVYQGPRWYLHRRRALLVPLQHPLRYLRELFVQARRDKVNAQAASDVVLAEIRR